MKTLQEIEELLIRKIDEEKQSIQVYEEKIQEVAKEKKQIEMTLLKAEKNVNANEYYEAKNAIQASEYAKELYIKQREKIKKEALVTKEEYNRLLSEITEIANNAHENQNSRAIDLIFQLKEIADESSHNWQQANKLMNLLQRNVYKEPEGKKTTEDGYVTWSSDKKYDYTEQTVHSFYRDRIEGTNFMKRAGDKGKLTEYKFWV